MSMIQLPARCIPTEWQVPLEPSPLPSAGSDKGLWIDPVEVKPDMVTFAEHTNPHSKRVALVTGAAHGIGKAFSLALSWNEIRVAMLDIDGDALKMAAKRMATSENQVLPLVADVTDESAVEKAVDATIERFGRLDILVNNAGLIFDVRNPIESISIDTWRRSLDVNATGTFLMCRAAIPHMRSSGFGRIVNLTSALVGTGAPGRVHYVSSKAAIIGLTRSLAREVGPFGITVNALAPGLVDSGPRARQFVNEGIFAFEEQRRCIPSRMFPDALTSALLFLISEDSNFVTGQVLIVDCGVVMR